MSRRPTLLLTGFALLILQACATTTDSSDTTDSYCAIAHPFLWSAKDTDETIRQAKEWNARGVALCGWQGH